MMRICMESMMQLLGGIAGAKAPRRTHDASNFMPSIMTTDYHSNGPPCNILSGGYSPKYWTIALSLFSQRDPLHRNRPIAPDPAPVPAGSIPPELGNLSQLQGFSLGANQLSGCIPAG